VPSVPSLPASACPHDLGPGTTVCLRCRQEQRDAVRTRQQQMLGLCGVAAMGLLGIYVMGASAANAWHATTRTDTVTVATRASVVASSVNGGSEVRQQGTATPAPLAAPASAGAPAAMAPVMPPAMPAATPAAVTPAPASAAHPLVAILVSEGRTDLTESLIAERVGDSVVVDFDTPATRTRRRDKFESVVRRTLPMVYGAPVDSVLRTIPDGAIVGGADLLGELPKRGVHVPLGPGVTLDLWPETRPGQDGPLVVSYWARVTRR
jgi:hypothetical protein